MLDCDICWDLMFESWNFELGILNVWFSDLDISKTFETFSLEKLKIMKFREFWDDIFLEIWCILDCWILKFWKALKILKLLVFSNF
jgi:hypothetical protein